MPIESEVTNVSTQDSMRRRTKVAQRTVEERLNRLEKVVDEVLNRLSSERPRKKDWRRTIGKFDGDPIIKEIVDGKCH